MERVVSHYTVSRTGWLVPVYVADSSAAAAIVTELDKAVESTAVLKKRKVDLEAANNACGPADDAP